MTPEQAEKFIQAIHRSSDPRIRRYNAMIKSCDNCTASHAEMNRLNDIRSNCQITVAARSSTAEIDMPQKDQAKHRKEWREIYERIKSALQRFGEDEEAGVGDYFVIDDIIEPNTHLLQIQRLHMLRPEIMSSLQRTLIGFPDWQIKVFVISPEEKTIIDPENGLLLRSDGIVDTLDRTMLPSKYRGLRYEGSRRP
jgi:hypothetical protein